MRTQVLFLALPTNALDSMVESMLVELQGSIPSLTYERIDGYGYESSFQGYLLKVGSLDASLFPLTLSRAFDGKTYSLVVSIDTVSNLSVQYRSELAWQEDIEMSIYRRQEPNDDKLY